MEIIFNELPGSKVELKFTVAPAEAKPYIDKVVEEISIGKQIPGFRPGKAPYAEVVKVAGGEMQVWQMAFERVVRAFYVKTVLEKGLETIGSPEVAVDQLTPGQDIKFTCTVAVMPTIIKSENIEIPFVELRIKEIKDADVEEGVQELRKMRRQEVVTDETADKDGLIIVDLEMKKDGVVLEGGVAKEYKIYLNEDHYIPKLTEQLIGMKKGEHKTFTLPFPKEHYQKAYAGKDVDFDVDVKEVYKVVLPEANDEFAKTLGVDSIQALRDLLRYNLTSENERKALDVAEVELLETLVKKSSFTEVPEILIKEEVRRIFEEIRRDVENRGGRMEDYLSSLKKSPDEMRLELIPQAIKRVQTAIYIRNAAKENGVEISDKELDEEIDRILSRVDDKETRDHVSSPDYRDYVATMMRNRKTLEILKEKGIKNYKVMIEKFVKEESEHAHNQHGYNKHEHGPDCKHE